MRSNIISVEGGSCARCIWIGIGNGAAAVAFVMSRLFSFIIAVQCAAHTVAFCSINMQYYSLVGTSQILSRPPPHGSGIYEATQKGGCGGRGASSKYVQNITQKRMGWALYDGGRLAQSDTAHQHTPTLYLNWS